MPNRRIDLDEYYRNQTRERYLRAARSFEFHRITEASR
jgi:hypothetical protein